jgi:Bacterial protein of unknown function (Gcw_chp)
MKKVVLSVVAAMALSSATAFAADMPVKAMKAVEAPSPWDIAFGSAAMTDYIFRGVTQSNHKPSVAAYFEPRYNINPNLQLYVGLSGESIDFANRAAAEIDFYGGVRPTFGPLALDFGFWYYDYPGGQCFGGFPAAGPAACTNVLPNGNAAKADASFYEVYGHATYTLGDFAFGPNFYYSPNFLNTGASGEYLSGTAKYTAPAGMALPNGVGWYVSGEFGRQWLGTSDSFYGTGPGTTFAAGIPYADYNTWNIGLGFTWKVFTLDLRYSDTNLSKGNCNAFTSDFTGSGASNVTAINPTGVGSNWCGSTFLAKLSADLTLGSLK